MLPLLRLSARAICLCTCSAAASQTQDPLTSRCSVHDSRGQMRRRELDKERLENLANERDEVRAADADAARMFFSLQRANTFPLPGARRPPFALGWIVRRRTG